MNRMNKTEITRNMIPKFRAAKILRDVSGIRGKKRIMIDMNNAIETKGNDYVRTSGDGKEGQSGRI